MTRVPPGVGVDAQPALSVMDKVVVTLHEGEHAVTLEWVATAENDMWADSVLATILHIEDRCVCFSLGLARCYHRVG